MRAYDVSDKDGIISRLSSVCEGVASSMLKAHVDLLGKDYLDLFSVEEICQHLKGIMRLGPHNPVEVLLHKDSEDLLTCTVIAKDYPLEFSMITGILAATGFDITSGDIFTYSRPVPRISVSEKNTTRRMRKKDEKVNRYIVDVFEGKLTGIVGQRKWEARVKDWMRLIIGMLERGDEESVNEARHMVNEAVVKRLTEVQGQHPPVLYPVHLEIDNESSQYTRLKVVSEDTPAFLYALSNALSRLGVSIEHVRIRTVSTRIEDDLLLLGQDGKKVTDPKALDKIKLSTLMTKQFTYFLAKAPDPYGALSRFERMVDDVASMPEKGQWMELLSNPRTMDNLARVLGASDFLWEDFIRQQYENIIPMVGPYIKGKRFSKSPKELTTAIESLMSDASCYEEKRKRINVFKDREIFLIDLDHILNPDFDFHRLAQCLTILAENIIRQAFKIVFHDLAKKYGRPRTVAGLEAKYAVMGLGKMGGAALGYASDIELLFVYGDTGKTDGPKIITNAEFFERLVREVNLFIQAKRDGIFQLDLRLRPYGNDGPLACSLENFWRYYGPGGPAHSFERLALVRMRTIAGDPELGRQIEHMRDSILYVAKCVDMEEVQALREKQIKEMDAHRRLNAKFSPGGLVDIEYSIQILQVKNGGEIPALRTSRMDEALNALANAGILGGQEALTLVKAYDFLRNLINALRMLGGSAKDLYLPERDSDEFEHLATRMGYKRGESLSPSEKLRIDFEAYTAAVRSFLEKHFGLQVSSSNLPRTVADLVLSESPSAEIRDKILLAEGLKEPARAYLNLLSLAGHGSRKQVFSRLAVLAFDILSRTPDPDMALNNWERFVRTLGSAEAHFRSLLSQPQRLEILLKIFSSSQFLSDTLIRNPGFLDWVMIPQILNRERKREELEEELRLAASSCVHRKEWLNKIRRVRRREVLRVGVRDICLRVPTPIIIRELSTVAEAFVQVVLEEALKRVRQDKGLEQDWQGLQTQFCIMAMGKLGGRELNYSSDIDLVGVCADINDPFRTIYNTVMEHVATDLSSHTEEGYAYRTDLRLRPFGSVGELVPTLSSLVDYYKNKASLWEIQAALKMRPVAGNISVGRKLLERIRPILTSKRKLEEIREPVERMRRITSVPHSAALLRKTRDLKVGLGGIRDVEFFVQGNQLVYGHMSPSLLKGNTLDAIDALAGESIITQQIADDLKRDYIFLRRVEHFLQIYEDRQVHCLPREEEELESLAKRVLGEKAKAADLSQYLDEIQERITGVFNSLFEGHGQCCPK